MKNEPVRILLIEDDPGDARLVQEALKETGAARFKLDWVDELAKGMEALLVAPADVVLLDLNLPDSTGIETFNRVHDQAPQIPLILLTGQDDEELAGIMVQEGADDFIAKGRMDGILLARSIRYAIERKQAEGQLKLLKYSIDTAPDAAYWLDPEGCFLYINETGCQALGYGRNELMQKHVSLVNPRATPERWAQVWKDLKDKKNFTIESVHRRKDGSEFHVEITSVYVKFGEKEYCNGFARDITERKQAEEKRQQSEILFRTLFELSPDAILLIDPNDAEIRSRIINCNAAACLMSGYQRDELIGHSIEIVNESPYSQAAEIAYLDKIRTEGSIQMEVLHRHKNGTVFPVEVSSTIIKVGERELLIGIDRDITGRKQAEQAQRQSELQFRALFELSPDAIMLIDPHHPDISWPILDCNETACRMNGYRRDELIGQSIDLLNLNPGSQEERIAYMKQLREAGNLHVESFHRHKNGSVFPVEISTTVIKVGERELVIGIDRDITERRSIEDKLKESEEQFRSFIEQSSEGVVLLDEQGSVIGWNQAEAQITGIASQQVLGKPFWEIQYQLLPPERRAARSPEFFKEAMLAASKTGKFPTAGKALEAVICTPGGEIKSILQSSFPIKTEKGYRIGSVVRDITERKRAEEAVRLSEARYRNLVETQSDIIARSDLAGKLTFVNDAYCRTFGKTYEQVLGDDYFPTVLPEDLPITLEALEAIKKPPYRKQTETRHQTVEGIRWFGWENSAVLDEGGNPAELQGVGRDITERKRAEIERQTLLEIMQGLPNANNLQEYLRLVHHAVGKAIFAGNFFVILKNKTTGLFEEVYSVDKYDPPSQPSLLEKSICAYVFRTGEALLMNPTRFSELKSSGEVELVGADSKSWLGVPLTTSRETIGVMAVQDYDMEGRYSEHEKEFLVSIAGQIAQLVERKRAEENLHTLFLRHEALLAAIPEIVMEVNNDKVYTWANQAGREFFGEQVIGREAAFYFEGEQTVYQEVQPLFNGDGSTIYLESWQRRKDGQKRLLAWWCQSLKDQAGNVTGALSSARDITEQKLVEEQIKKQMAELQRWYDLTLDRENRSLELKHEVNELLSRLNEPPRYSSAETRT